MKKYRVCMIEILTDFATKGAQIDWYRSGIESLPDFLYGRWKTFFTPLVEKFKLEFSEDELQQLIRFEEFFLERVSDFPEDLDALLKDFRWNSVCEFAALLVGDLTQNSEKLDTKN